MMINMDPSDLNDARPLNPPLGLWRDMVVSNINHDGFAAVSFEDHEMAERIAMDVIELMEGISLSEADSSIRMAWENRPARAC